VHVLGLLESLVGTAVAAAVWIVGAVVGAFTVFVGLTLAVALFHPDAERGTRAREVLHDLLVIFTSKGGSE
jgi:hypothetical protein